MDQYLEEAYLPALHRASISTVARGGTYMLNIGPKAEVTVPENAKLSLQVSGEWIKRYPQVVYATDPSPWKHFLPCGDITCRDNTLFLSVYEWPRDGKLYLPGLKNEIIRAYLLQGTGKSEITYTRDNGWIILDIPFEFPEKLVSVLEIELEGTPEVDPCYALDPDFPTYITAHFAETEGCQARSKRWMEKFGEWKRVEKTEHWEENGKATWEVDV